MKQLDIHITKLHITSVPWVYKTLLKEENDPEEMWGDGLADRALATSGWSPELTLN